MISLSSGHSAEYLTGAVAQGRENYYTGAVAAGEPPGRWYGARRRGPRPGRRGRPPGHGGALRAHFLDPRDERFRDRDRWGEAATPRRSGHGGTRTRRRTLVRDMLAAEPDATPERRQQIRLRRPAVRHVSGRVHRRDVLRAEVGHGAARRVRGAGGEAARRAGDSVAADAWAAHRHAVEDAIWAGQRRRAGLPARTRPATPASATTAAPPAGGSTRTTGRSRRSSSTTAATTTRSCTSTTRSSTGSSAPTGGGARSTPGAARYARRGRARSPSG